MALRVNAGVKTGPLGKRMIAFVGKYYPKANEIYVTSGMDGDHGPRPNGSHHYGLKYRNSPTAALDFGGGGVTPTGSRRMRDFAKWLYDNFAIQLVELIHTTPYSNDKGFYVKGGRKLPNGGGVLSASLMSQHRNHVHLAVSAATMALMERMAAAKWVPKKAAPVKPPIPAPVSTLTLFVDVSKHDWSRLGHNLDWKRVVAQGLGAAAIVRATYGDPKGFSPDSPNFVEMARAAKAAGIRAVGGYHNLIKGDAASVARQIDFHRAALDAGDCLFGMADVEAYEELKTQRLVPDWDTIRRFNDQWLIAEPDRVMAWYIPRSMWGMLGEPDLRELVGPLINADYPIISAGRPADLYPRSLVEANSKVGDRAWDPYGRRTPDIWQFTSKGVVDGASATTDVNAFRGDANALVNLFTDEDAEA